MNDAERPLTSNFKVFQLVLLSQPGGDRFYGLKQVGEYESEALAHIELEGGDHRYTDFVVMEVFRKV